MSYPRPTSKSRKLEASSSSDEEHKQEHHESSSNSNSTSNGDTSPGVPSLSKHGIQSQSSNEGRKKDYLVSHKLWLNAEDRSECITDLSRLLEISSFPVSRLKAQQAKSILWW